MVRQKVQISIDQFLDGYRDGYITECISVMVAGKQRVYGRDPRGMVGIDQYKIVWCEV